MRSLPANGSLICFNFVFAHCIYEDSIVYWNGNVCCASTAHIVRVSIAIMCSFVFPFYFLFKYSRYSIRFSPGLVTRLLNDSMADESFSVGLSLLSMVSNK